jgi:hypothetical protein
MGAAVKRKVHLERRAAAFARLSKSQLSNIGVPMAINRS